MLEHVARKAGIDLTLPSKSAERDRERQDLPRSNNTDRAATTPQEEARTNPRQRLTQRARRALTKTVGFVLAIFALGGAYAIRPTATMNTSTKDDECAFACSHFSVTNSSQFSLHDVSAQCLPQKLTYSDEFTLVMDGLGTTNPLVKSLEPGESMVVVCGYVLRHFVQPSFLLLSHGDPRDEHTKIIRIRVNDQQQPLLDAKGQIVSAPAIHGGKDVALGQELPLSQADIVFHVSYTSRVVPFYRFNLDRRFQLLAVNKKLDWQPVPLSNPEYPATILEPTTEF